MPEIHRTMLHSNRRRNKSITNGFSLYCSNVIDIIYETIKSEVAKENNENYLTDEEQHKIIIKDYDMLFEYRE